MDPTRVAITGLGAVSALGTGVPEFWTALQEGRSGIRPVKAFTAGALRFPNAAEVSGFHSAGHFAAKQLSLLDPFAQFGLVAAREALKDSGLVLDGSLLDRTAIVTGSSAGGQAATDEGFVELYDKKMPRVNPLMIPRVMSNSAASQISMEFGVRGPVFSVSTACSSSNHAIGQALALIRAGACDTAIAGGCEAVFSYGFIKAWEAMRVISTDTCRPFSRNRSGLILGEGAGFLILEKLVDAQRRGARIYAELAGCGMSSDAHHITQPSPDGAALAISNALADARMAADQVGYVNAHGTATPANDPAETAAIRLAFASHADALAVSSTKSMHGHALGAAGAIEAVATVLALYHGCLPPTANFTEPDPECDLDVIPNAARELQVNAAVSNSFAFGGLNAVLVFRRAN